MLFALYICTRTEWKWPSKWQWVNKLFRAQTLLQQVYSHEKKYHWLTIWRPKKNIWSCECWLHCSQCSESNAGKSIAIVYCSFIIGRVHRQQRHTSLPENVQHLEFFGRNETLNNSIQDANQLISFNLFVVSFIELFEMQFSFRIYFSIETMSKRNLLLFAKSVCAYLDTRISDSSIWMNNDWQLIRAVFSSVSCEPISWYSFFGHWRRWLMLIASHILCTFACEHNAEHVSFKVYSVRSIFHFLSFGSFPHARNARNTIFVNALDMKCPEYEEAHTHSNWCSSHELSSSRDNVYCEISNAPVSTLRVNMKFCSKSYTLVELEYNVRTELVWSGIMSAHTLVSLTRILVGEKKKTDSNINSHHQADISVGCCATMTLTTYEEQVEYIKATPLEWIHA